jgi:hypothetical protein
VRDQVSHPYKTGKCHSIFTDISQNLVETIRKISQNVSSCTIEFRFG